MHFQAYFKWKGEIIKFATLSWVFNYCFHGNKPNHPGKSPLAQSYQNAASNSKNNGNLFCPK